MRECFNHCMTKEEYFSRIIEYLPSNNEDRLSVRSETNDNKQFQETYIFSKENPNQFTQIFTLTLKSDNRSV